MPYAAQKLFFVFAGELSHAAFARMHLRSSQMLLVHVLSGNAFDYGGTGKEHIGSPLNHENEVRQGGGVHRSSGTWAHDGRNLRDYSACENVPFEYLTISGQCVYSFLYAGSSRVVDADAGYSRLQCHVHDLAYFLRHGFAQRPSVHRKVLGIDIYEPSVYGAPARNDTVSVYMVRVHPEVSAPVADERIEFFE